MHLYRSSVAKTVRVQRTLLIFDTELRH